MHDLEIRQFGLTEYREAQVYQEELVRERRLGRRPDQLLLLEHFPAVAIGSGGDCGQLVFGPEWFERRGIGLYKTNRGGGAAYHGPGQLVAYPITDLSGSRDIHKFLRRLEAVAVDSLADLGVRAETVKGLTGVWIGDKKIAAVGIRVAGWVTSHGLAINVENDLEPYRAIVQCGLRGKGVTSVAEVLGRSPGVMALGRAFADRFIEAFAYKQVRKPGRPNMLVGVGKEEQWLNVPRGLKYRRPQIPTSIY